MLGRSYSTVLCQMQLLPETALCTHRVLLTCSFLEMDNTGERVDQRGREEVRRREMEGHLPEIPLPEPHGGDDQGSLADHEKAGNPLNSGAMRPSVQKNSYFSFERWTGAMVAQRLLCSFLVCVGAGVVSPSGSWYLRLLQQREPCPTRNEEPVSRVVAARIRSSAVSRSCTA